MPSQKLVSRFPALFWSPDEFDVPDRGDVRPIRAPILDRNDLPSASKVDTAAYLHDFFVSRLEKSDLANPPCAPPVDDSLVVGADEGGEPSISIAKVGLPEVPKGPPADCTLFDEVSLTPEQYEHVQKLASEIEIKTGIKPDIIALGKDVKKSMEDPNHVVSVKKASDANEEDTKNFSAHGDYGPSVLGDVLSDHADLELLKKKLYEGLAVPKEFFIDSTPGTGKSSFAAACEAAKYRTCATCAFFQGAVVDPLSGAVVHAKCSHGTLPDNIVTKKYMEEASGKHTFLCFGYCPCT